MDKAPRCYGEYGSGDCDACPFEEWCVSAADIPPLDESYRFREFAQNFEGWDAIETKDEDEGTRLSKLLGELLVELEDDRADLLWDFLAGLSALSKEYPRVYRVVRFRIRNPLATYQQIADVLGLSRAAVEQHLQKSVALLPELKAMYPLPRVRLSRTTGAPFEVRCTGGRICILAGTASVVLTMPMDEQNSATVTKLCDGLNNMHWKKRDALLEELR